ncbi:hypothetical protein BK011_03565 [Tenericutes bacterium MZ-XQ]|jgi:uncharacterized membrane protein YraQ (UPF0718 family)|nr:hypothetical protein BK011_03565 [Tenericutes bacterium MZ-XQ]
MKRMIKKQKFLMISIIMLIVMTIIDISMTYRALENTYDQIISMLLIVPPIFILIGLFDVWVPKETIVEHMGENSKTKGMILSFILGAFSAGPTLIAFPIAYMMLRKGAKYSNVLFFLMVWSSLKLPIILFQIAELGFRFAMIIDITLLVLFYISASIIHLFVSKTEIESFVLKAQEL